MPGQTPKKISKHQTHAFGQFLLERTGAKGVVVCTPRPELLIGSYPADTPLFINTGLYKKARFKKQLLRHFPNLAWVDTKALKTEFLQDKVLVCEDFLKLAKPAQLMQHALVSVATSSVKNAKRVSQFVTSLPKNQTVLSGHVKLFRDSKNKEQLAVIGGPLVDIAAYTGKPLRVLAVVPQYNERDVIGSTVRHLLTQGVDVHVIDNWSTDGGYELVQSLAKEFPGRVSIEKFPEKKDNIYNWTKILKRVTTVADEVRDKYDWVTLNDADELRWAPWEGITLQQAFSFIDSLGYNCIDYTVFNFKPTTDGFTEKDNAATFFTHGEFGGLSGYFVQVKSWKNSQPADLASSGGHHVIFPALRVYPLKFLLCHYPLRSSKQAKQKIFQDRNPRFPAAEKKKGWHTHYLGVTEEASFIESTTGLVHYQPDSFLNDYFYEWLSGVGIKRQKDIKRG